MTNKSRAVIQRLLDDAYMLAFLVSMLVMSVSVIYEASHPIVNSFVALFVVMIAALVANDLAEPEPPALRHPAEEVLRLLEECAHCKGSLLGPDEDATGGSVPQCMDCAPTDEEAQEWLDEIRAARARLDEASS